MSSRKRKTRSIPDSPDSPPVSSKQAKTKDRDSTDDVVEKKTEVIDKDATESDIDLSNDNEPIRPESGGSDSDEDSDDQDSADAERADESDDSEMGKDEKEEQKAVRADRCHQAPCKSSRLFDCAGCQTKRTCKRHSKNCRMNVTDDELLCDDCANCSFPHCKPSGKKRSLSKCTKCNESTHAECVEQLEGAIASEDTLCFNHLREFRKSWTSWISH